MKHFLILTALSFFYSCCNCPPTEKVETQTVVKKSGIVVEATQKGVYEWVYLVEVKLINYTDSNFEFVTWSGASSGNIITDASRLDFFIPNCSSNYVIPITLKPFEEYSILVALKGSLAEYYNPRFGFIITKDLDQAENISELRKSQRNVIWSEPIHLSGTTYKMFEIKKRLNDSTFSIIKE